MKKLLLISLFAASAFAEQYANSADFDRALAAKKCNHIEHLYSYAIDYASRTGSLDMAMNYPISKRDQAVTQVMDQATKYICSGNINKGLPWQPKGEYTFKKLQNAYAKCVAKYNR